MSYKHLKDFLEQANQKLFWVLTYGNGVGMVLGLFAAYYLSKALPWLPGALLYPLGLLAGLALTWTHQGQPTYYVLLLWGQFQARRVFAGATLDVATSQYYRRPLATTRPFALDGLVSYSGEDTRPGRSGRMGRHTRISATGDGRKPASPGSVPIRETSSHGQGTLPATNGHSAEGPIPGREQGAS